MSSRTEQERIPDGTGLAGSALSRSASQPKALIPCAGSKELSICSFCHKNQEEVLCLIAGPTVFICDECVELCNGILFDHRVRSAVQRAMGAGQ